VRTSAAEDDFEPLRRALGASLAISTRQEFRAAIDEFNRWEHRAYVCYVVFGALKVGWGDPGKTSKATGVLLEIWHSAFCRYGPFDLPVLTICVADCLPASEALSSKSVQGLSKEILCLSQRDNRKRVQLRSLHLTRSPVAATSVS
jgi:hypothetical protein